MLARHVAFLTEEIAIRIKNNIVQLVLTSNISRNTLDHTRAAPEQVYGGNRTRTSSKRRYVFSEIVSEDRSPNPNPNPNFGNNFRRYLPLLDVRVRMPSMVRIKRS